MPLDYEKLAEEAAGNWRKFESFGWGARPEDAENWCIQVILNRDSNIVAKSNASVVEHELKKYTEEGDDSDMTFERFNHWACGWTDNVCVRVYKDGEITPAFIALCDIMAPLEEHPILDDSDYSERVDEALVESISWSSSNVDLDFAPETWEEDVLSHLQGTAYEDLNPDGEGHVPSELVNNALQEFGWWDDGDALRHVRFDDHELMTWDTNEYDRMGKSRLAYRLVDPQNEIIFSGRDFFCSPMDCVDSDGALRSILRFLTMQDGDTDDEYFEKYTKKQLEWRDEYAEDLSMWALDAAEFDDEDFASMRFENMDEWGNDVEES